MKIIQYLNAGEDYPLKLKGNRAFHTEVVSKTRTKLKLRWNDTVIVHGIIDDIH